MADEDIDIDALIDTMLTFKRQRDRAELAFKRAQTLIMETMDKSKAKSIVTQGGRKVTLVEGKQTSWNEDVLRQILGPKWDEVTKQVLDPGKLEMVVERDKIPEESLQDALIETPKAGYLRVTEPKVRGS